MPIADMFGARRQKAPAAHERNSQIFLRRVNHKNDGLVLKFFGHESRNPCNIHAKNGARDARLYGGGIISQTPG